MKESLQEYCDGKYGLRVIPYHRHLSIGPRLVYKSSDFVRRRVVESTLINDFENMNVPNGSFKLNKVLENIRIKNVDYHQ